MNSKLDSASPSPADETVPVIGNEPGLPLVPAPAVSVGSEAEVIPARKRGIFLASRFFGGREKEGAVSGEQVSDEMREPIIPGATGAAEASPFAGDPAAGSVTASPVGEPIPLAKPAHFPSPPAEAGAPEPSDLMPTAFAPVRVTTPPAGDHPANPASARDGIADIQRSVAQPTTTPFASPRPFAKNLATAQLTLGFEISSLELSSSFRVKTLRLKAISDLVALHFLTDPAAKIPLAAEISFRVEQVALDATSRIRSVVLKPFEVAHQPPVPRSLLAVNEVTLVGGDGANPIAVTTSEQDKASVLIFGEFQITELDLTPAFEIGSLKLEPVSNRVFVSVSPLSSPTAAELPPAFQIAEVQTGTDGQLVGLRVVVPEDEA